MDTIPSSRKRNHPSGTLTRTRSQLYLHRNRSGQLRFDPVPTQDEPYAELAAFRRTNCKKPKRDDDELPRRLTKDLRARRVYSPPQSTNAGLIEGTFSKGSAEATESPDLELFCEARSFDAESLEESSKLQDCKGKNGGDCSEKIDGLDGATTLPDADICGGSASKVNEDEGKLEAEVPVQDTPSTWKNSNGNDSSLKSKSVLRPRFRVKLFRAPGSVNYRRLFPFLVDTAGDNSGTPKLGFCQKDKEDGPEFQLPLSSLSQEESKQELKTDATADYGVKDVASDLPNDDLKQLSGHMNNLDRAEASNHSACTSQEFGVLNEECIQTTPPDADIYVNSEVNAKPMDLTRSTRENAGEGFCLKADKGKDSLKSKSVPRQHLHRKLFKTPGSISYKRLLPFLMDLTKDDSDTSKFDHHQTHHQEDEADMHAKRVLLPLSSQREESSIDEHKTDSSPMHGTVESNGLENYVLVNPSNELSHGNQPKLTPSQDLPTQLDTKEVVREDLSAACVNEHIENIAIGSKDECLSASELNSCLVMVDDFHSAKNVAHNDGIKEVQNKISRQHNSESPPRDQDMLYINRDVSELTFVHRSSKEKGFAIDYDESKQFVNLEERESVSRFPPESQSLSQLDPNMLDAEDNVTSLNHVRVSNDLLRSPSKIISEKSDMTGHSGDKAGSVQNGMVLCSRMPSKDSDNKNASEIEKGSESKTTSVLKRCPQFKLLKQAGSLNYKRLLPFLLNTMKDNSCASVNDHYPKHAKSMDQTPLLPISTSDLRLTPVSDSNGCVPMEHCAGNSGTHQQTGLHACDLNDDSSSPKSQIPEFQSSHDSCKVIQLQDEQVVLNGLCKPESSTHECCQSLSQLEVVEQHRVPAVGLKKGVLKRNPRGCRGLCTCLNCVSFRLHAERAFEFSRNQLLDAEEVAHDLMNELSNLRNILQRSADSVNNNPVFDGSQVKEASRKAFAAEERAKGRLSQMQDDLNIHCRITSLQPPRVTFAVHVEEKVIQPGG